MTHTIRSFGWWLLAYSLLMVHRNGWIQQCIANSLSQQRICSSHVFRISTHKLKPPGNPHSKSTQKRNMSRCCLSCVSRELCTFDTGLHWLNIKHWSRPVTVLAESLRSSTAVAYHRPLDIKTTGNGPNHMKGLELVGNGHIARSESYRHSTVTQPSATDHLWHQHPASKKSEKQSVFL